MNKQKKKTKKEEFQWCYEGLVNFVLRLENDLNSLSAIRGRLEIFTDRWASGEENDKRLLHEIEKHIVPKLAELKDRLLQSAKKLPYANQVYYARQDPQPGEDWGTDDREPLL